MSNSRCFLSVLCATRLHHSIDRFRYGFGDWIHSSDLKFHVLHRFEQNQLHHEKTLLLPLIWLEFSFDGSSRSENKNDIERIIERRKKQQTEKRSVNTRWPGESNKSFFSHRCRRLFSPSVQIKYLPTFNINSTRLIITDLRWSASYIGNLTALKSPRHATIGLSSTVRSSLDLFTFDSRKTDRFGRSYKTGKIHQVRRFSFVLVTRFSLSLLLFSYLRLPIRRCLQPRSNSKLRLRPLVVYEWTWHHHPQSEHLHSFKR